ncbi:DUF1772 domain-containing protein [Pseudonocardia humida]|uniref:DUF1772 domain-containing protein n=1 Tax=Pseudonocardia humida TaxID=2800819 RepID=A0ABT1ABY9_9PSEU|nr:DUF1772 domain-containing protein [Pseudonocardia humida]MCO1660552.1 DUF1772 domain-containing protein [Pseudonocardia humida]
MPRRPSLRPPRLAGALLAAAQFGQAQWFFGNLYEAVVQIPDRLAHRRDLAVPPGEPVTVGSMLRPGSPVRFYLPLAPVTVGAAVAALGVGWNGAAAQRRWSTASVAGTLTAGLSTAYIVRAINVRLFFAAEPPSAEEREALLRRWYALNAIRMAATAVAWIGARRARSSTR